MTVAGDGIPGQKLMVEREVPIPMRDGTVLVADVYRPEGGSWPVLIQRTSYGKRSMIGIFVSLDPLQAASAGYAVVIQDVRGRGGSDGQYYPFVNEAPDGYDTVEWAATQHWSTGRVAMYGNSYMGATQWQAALATPPHLEALCPVQASSDYYEGRSYRGGAFEIGALLSVSLYAAGVGSAVRATGDRDHARSVWREARKMLADIPAAARRRPLSKLRDTVVAELAPFFFDWLDHPDPDAYWEGIAVEGHYDQVDVPALHVTSWFDQFHVGTLRNYEGMRAGAASPDARENQFLVVGPWGHYPPRSALVGSARVGDVNFGLSALIDLDALQLSWFGRWLHDDKGPWRLRSRVRLFVMGENAWRDEDEWPLARAEERPLFLRGTNSRQGAASTGWLDWTAPKSEPADDFVYDPADPVPTRGGSHLVLEADFPEGPLDQRSVEARRDVLSYTSDLLGDDLEVTGWVRANLWVTSSAPCTDFTVKLVDVHPDGRALNVCDGVRRARMPSSSGGPAADEVVVELGATSQVFMAGHRIRVDISSSNFPRFDLNPNTGVRTSQDAVPAHQRVFHSEGTSSHILLPIVPR